APTSPSRACGSPASACGSSAAERGAVVAGVGAALEPAVVVDAHHLADAEPVGGRAFGDDVEAGGPQLVRGRRVVPALDGDLVAGDPERAWPVERRLRVETAVDEVPEHLHVALRLHGAADDPEDRVGTPVAPQQLGDDRG